MQPRMMNCLLPGCAYQLREGRTARLQPLAAAEQACERARYPKLPILALTATATPRVEHDVIQQLNLENCVTFRSSFNRPNLRCGAHTDLPIGLKRRSCDSASTLVRTRSDCFCSQAASICSSPVTALLSPS